MIITEHAQKRAKERLGLSKSAITNLARKALTEGKQHKDFSGRMKRYLDKTYLMYKNANNTRIYGRNIFIFNDDTLITVFLVPNKLNTHNKL